MGIAAYNRGTRAIAEQISQQLRENRQADLQHEHARQDLAPDGGPWMVREPNRQTPHADNGWQYHYPR